MVVRIILLFVFLIHIKALQITPLKIKIDYFNPKYIKSINLSMRKINRHSPYYINFEVELLAVLGNNITVSLLGYEYISGRYIPTAFYFKYKLCEFLNEPLVGQTILKAMPANLTCPFAMGNIHINNMTFDLDNFPFLPVFTWSDLRAQGRLDVNLTKTSTGENVVYGYSIGAVTQSLESKSIKIPSRKPQPIHSRVNESYLPRN